MEFQTAEIKELASALAKAQSEITAAKKDANNPHFGHKYAGLASVWDACREPLTKNGLSVVQATGYDPDASGALVLITTMLHTSGQWMRSVTPIFCSKPNDAQAMGSGITYARRYAMAGIAGVAPDDDDDDGNAATSKNQPPANNRQQHASIPTRPLQRPAPAPAPAQGSAPASKSAVEAPTQQPTPAAPQAAIPDVDPEALKAKLLDEIVGKEPDGKFRCRNLGTADSIFKVMQNRELDLGPFRTEELYMALSRRCAEHMDGLMRTDVNKEGVVLNWEAVNKFKHLFTEDDLKALILCKDQMKDKLPTRAEMQGRK